MVAEIMEIEVIWNIIDRRKRSYRFEAVTAIFEPTWHDNACPDGDQAPKFDGEGMGYMELETTSIATAIRAGERLPYAVTLYLYDEGANYEVPSMSHA